MNTVDKIKEWVDAMQTDAEKWAAFEAQCNQKNFAELKRDRLRAALSIGAEAMPEDARSIIENELEVIHSHIAEASNFIYLLRHSLGEIGGDVDEAIATLRILEQEAAECEADDKGEAKGMNAFDVINQLRLASEGKLD
jgi:hypothetical protein